MVYRLLVANCSWSCPVVEVLAVVDSDAAVAGSEVLAAGLVAADTPDSAEPDCPAETAGIAVAVVAGQAAGTGSAVAVVLAVA